MRTGRVSWHTGYAPRAAPCSSPWHHLTQLLRCLPQGPPRCSSLQAPIMLLSGHEGEVYCCKFHPNGNTLASAGFDRLICEYQAALAQPALRRAGAHTISVCRNVGSPEHEVVHKEGRKKLLPAPLAGHCSADPQTGLETHFAGHSPVFPGPSCRLPSACVGLQQSAEMQLLMLWLAEVKIITFL